ncbi:hypothetical protein L208DRAFT_1374387 [Tricholoma matsutake]|nr:hypothetical protein L208DRAFT_1374387 [Tricholoma matsutake 945]
MFKNVRPGHQPCGITLSMDKVTSNGHLCYLTATDEIAGLCEHAMEELSSVKMGKDLHVARAIRQAIWDGKVHVGQEIFVAAFTQNDEMDYGAWPVLLMPTCKQDSFWDAALIMEMLHQAWKISPFSEALHGTIWLIASDSNPKWHPALYLHCMIQELTPADPLHQYVGKLCGMNLYTGLDGMTQDLDVKHDLKSKHIDLVSVKLLVLMTCLTDVDWSDNPIYSLLKPDSSIVDAIHTQLSPKDPQDIPRAIKLLRLIAKLQCKVFLCLLGDDVLKVLFGHVWMIGAHSPNFNAEEMRNQVGSALRLDAIFKKYSKWESRPQQLKFKCSWNVDHLSPRQWRGELRASTCDLHACWEDGVHQAEIVLAQHGYSINFEQVFQDWHLWGVDLMRPKGGKYPGISVEVDRSLVQETLQMETREDIELNLEYGFQQFNAKVALDTELLSTNSTHYPPHKIWMEIESGKYTHKKTILCYLLNSGLDIEDGKSSDCLLRVHYFSDGQSDWDQSKLDHPVSDPSTFQLGSLYATLVSIDQTKVATAILQCTLLKSGSEYLNHVSLDEISLHDSAYEVSGQILSFIPLPGSTDADKILSEELDIIPGYMDTTWIMMEDNLNEIEKVLAQHVHENNDLRQKIPIFGPTYIAQV